PTQLIQMNIESRLKVLLPDDVGAALMDGVVLCHLANHICPRSVASIHVPSPAVPKLSMAKCRRNVENFLDACKKLGVPQETRCLNASVSSYDVSYHLPLFHHIFTLMLFLLLGSSWMRVF
uniref:Calponin-homology (CH) domain-containing protein n=1 Tax=Neolamprologus brichardi TaxID=32507 RepID=A0A3Q4IB04_NEOBR